jgi:hypothetical protein
LNPSHGLVDTRKPQELPQVDIIPTGCIPLRRASLNGACEASYDPAPGVLSGETGLSNSEEPTAAPAATTARTFTVKAILAGLIGGLAIGWFNSFNTATVRNPDLISNHLPTGALMIVILLAAVWNPLAGRLARSLAFSPRELVVTLFLTLVCCWLPASGFYRYFHRMVVIPAVLEPGKPNWQREGTLSFIPEKLFPLLRNPERFAQVAALQRQPQVDPVIAEILNRMPPAALEIEPVTPDISARHLEETRESLAVAAKHDPELLSAKQLADTLPSLAPTAGDTSAYALAFRSMRTTYLEVLPAAKREYERVYGGFTQGLAVGDRKVPFAELPWNAWLPTLAYWGPLVLLFMVCIVALSLIVHRQWSKHEQLSYPLATVMTSLVERPEGSLLPGILSNKMFWWGFFPILAYHACNYSATWFPAYVPRIDLTWGFTAELRAWFPVLNNVSDPWVTWGRISFLLVALSFFISSEMSLSMGLSSIVLLLVGVQTYQWTGGSPDTESARGGAYIAYAGILLYAGRTYYGMVLKKALGLGALVEADREPVWAARFFLLGFGAFIGLLIGPFGVDWLIAILFAITVMVLFLVLTRIICETGAPMMQAGWYPGTLLASTLGIGAVGAVPLVMICYLQPILAQDPREALMPYVANGLKVAENTGVRRSPLALLGFGAMAIALVVCFISLTKGIYNDGSSYDTWAHQYVPVIHLDAATRGLSQLSDTGQMESSSAAHGLTKLTLISTTGHVRELTWFFIGAGAVLFFGIMRFNFTWWPLHPVLFLVWGSYPAMVSWPSFLLGWAIKQLVVKFAGGKTYNQLKPLFLGIILGEIIAIACTIVIGVSYYLSTGANPKTYWILAG